MWNLQFMPLQSFWVHFQGISSANVWPLSEAGGFKDDTYSQEGRCYSAWEEGARGGKDPDLSSPWGRVLVTGPINQFNCYLKRRKLKADSNRKSKNKALGTSTTWANHAPCLQISDHLSKGAWLLWKLRLMISEAEREKSHSETVLSFFSFPFFFLFKWESIFTYTIITRNNNSTNIP